VLLREIGTLFSTMNFSVPPSSEAYGRGVELRLTRPGRWRLRLARRWPAYSHQYGYPRATPYREWRNVLVFCDGTTTASSVRVFFDGRNVRKPSCTTTFRKLESQERPSSGHPRDEWARLHWRAGHARLLARPAKAEMLAEASAQSALRFAWETPESERRPDQSALLRHACWCRVIPTTPPPPASRAPPVPLCSNWSALRPPRCDARNHGATLDSYTFPRPIRPALATQLNQVCPNFFAFPGRRSQKSTRTARWLTSPRHP